MTAAGDPLARTLAAGRCPFPGTLAVAAVFAAGVILVDATRVLRPAAFDLMDQAPGPAIVERTGSAALAVPGIRRIEHLRVRKPGTGYAVDLHAQADPALSLHEAHVLSGMVKGAIRGAVTEVGDVLVHMEPCQP